LEGAHLQVADVDSTRGVLHIHGKGRRDRYVPVPAAALGMLRAHWRTHRSPQWVFPAPVREGTRYFVPPGAGPISRTSLQSAFVRARKQSGIHKRAHVHTLRHSSLTAMAPRSFRALDPGAANTGTIAARSASKISTASKFWSKSTISTASHSFSTRIEPRRCPGLQLSSRQRPLI
jgi:integrase